MITAKDVQKKKFEKVKFGYSPEEVDSFLAQIENDLRLMQQDLDDSNEKIQLLADKVREYKDTEDDLKNALLLAQKQARQVVEEAQQKADAIVADAKASVDTVKSQALVDSETQLQNITAQLEAENAHLVETQHQVADFKRALFDLYKEHLELISRLPESADEVEYVEVEETEEAEETAKTAEAAAEAVAETAEAVKETAEATVKETAAAVEEAAAAPVFGSRRDDAGSAARRRFSDQ
ncbi:MAG: DivIVA domain-containing protein [Oscillospiraceae bacterium]|nr:DivIVA domain-containing protein [Oscillospiraceae bacterium]